MRFFARPAAWLAPIFLLCANLYATSAEAAGTGNCGQHSIAPAVTSYTASSSDDGTLISPANVVGGTILPLILPAPGSINSGWMICPTSDANNTVLAEAPTLAAPATPVLSSTSGGSISATTYYVKITYTNTVGETLPSSEASRAVGSNNLLVVTTPGASGNATGYNVYVATGSGSETKQNAAPIALGSNWTEPVGGLVSGASPPGSATATAAYIITNGQTLASFNLGPQNATVAGIQFDGTNFRILFASPQTLTQNGAANEFPSRWEYPGGPGYPATQEDNGAWISSSFTSGLTVTLPSINTISAGWSIGVSADLEALTVVTNGTNGGNIVLTGNGLASTYTVPSVEHGMSYISFDGANFRVSFLSWGGPLVVQLPNVGPYTVLGNPTGNNTTAFAMSKAQLNSLINPVNGGFPADTIACINGVSFASGNTDWPITIPYPYTLQWRVKEATVSNATASLAGTTGGFFFNPGGGGATIAADQAITVTQNSGNVNNNTQSLALASQYLTESYQTASPVYFRVGTGGVAQGASACLALRAGTYTPLEAWGDSLTAGVGSTGAGPYPNQLANLFFPPRTVINNGVGGYTSTQIKNAFLAAGGADGRIYGYGTVIWAGRNDYSLASTVEANIATMTSNLIPTYYLVLSIINGDYPWEYSGQTNYNQIAALNANLQATYGSYYVDVRSQLVAAYNPANPVDVIDRANDVPPYTLRGQDANGTLTQSGGIDAVNCNFTVSSTTVQAFYVLYIDSEYILVTSVAAGGHPNGCIRGYAGSTPAPHAMGASYTGTDPLHLNNAGYTIVANAIHNAIVATGNW